MQQIEGEIDKRLARLAKTVKVPGFRPGHVPIKMVAQQYGPQVRSDVISDAVQQSFNEAVREQNLRVAGYPRIEPATGTTPAEGTLEFSAVFEMYPEIKVGDVSSARPSSGRRSRSPTPTSTARVDVLRRQRATYAPTEDGRARPAIA